MKIYYAWQSRFQGPYGVSFRVDTVRHALKFECYKFFLSLYWR